MFLTNCLNMEGLFPSFIFFKNNALQSCYEIYYNSNYTLVKTALLLHKFGFYRIFGYCIFIRTPLSWTVATLYQSPIAVINNMFAPDKVWSHLDSFIVVLVSTANDFFVILISNKFIVVPFDIYSFMFEYILFLYFSVWNVAMNSLHFISLEK